MAVYKVNGVNNASQGTLELSEHYVYGSSRLGTIKRSLDADQPKYTSESISNLGNAYLINFTRGNKLFELTNHLGNVMATVSDRTLPEAVTGTPTAVRGYTTDIVTASDYYPFGMVSRAFNSPSLNYRYGFNGKEVDNEMFGVGNELDYGMRVYDPRVGRFLSVDPLTKQYPWYTPYQYAGNSPIANIDIDGLEEGSAIKKGSEEFGKTTFRVVVKEGVEQQAKVVAMKGVEKAAESPGFWSKFLPGVAAGAARVLGVVGGVLTSDWTPERNRNERPLPTFNPQPEPLPDTKPKDDDNDDFASVRFQVQTGRENISSTVRVNKLKIGVLKAQGYDALDQIYNDAIEIDPSLEKNKDFRSAIIKASEQIKAVDGSLSKGVNQTTIQSKFLHKKRQYRVDVEIQRGENFKQ